MATRSNQQTKPIETAQADTIAESKLARIQLIAREALDILGEDSPEVLRKSHAEAVAVFENQISGLETRLAGAAEQIRSVEGELRHQTRLAQDRLEEAEKVWDVAAEQAQTIKQQQTQIEERQGEIDEREKSIRELKSRLDEAGALATALREEIASTRSQAEKAQQRLDERIAELTAGIEAHEASLATLAMEMAEAVQERDSALAQVESTEFELSLLRDELSETSARLVESTDAVRTLRGRLEEVEERAETSQSLADELGARLETMAAQLAELGESEAEARADITAARTEIADLSGRLAERDQMISRLSQQTSRAPVVVEQKAAEQKPIEQVTSIDVPAEVRHLREVLDAKETEAAFMREQMDRADERADRYRDKMEQATEALEKANAIVMRARRRASARTQQYAQTIEAMSALHVRFDVLKGELAAAEARASRHLLIARLCGAAAGLTGLLAVISAF